MTEVYLVGAALVTAALILAALRLSVASHYRAGNRSGWVYFVGDGPDTPIKIGMTREEPTAQRLPELQTMSPIPLTLHYKFWDQDRYAAELKVHQDLERSRVRGEWFDREAALSYISHLKGEW